MQPTCSYLVCATPRSGSTLLCEILAQTSLAGRPKEYFEELRETGLPRRPKEYFTGHENVELMAMIETFAAPDDMSADELAQSHAHYREYLAHVLEEGTTANGVFGAKLMWGYFDDFISNVRDIPDYRQMPVPALLSTIFPNLHYIQVTRRDKVRQAISLWKAIQTWKWREDTLRSSHSIRNQPARPQAPLRFHAGAIDHLIERIEEHEQQWQHFFSETHIQPFRIVYEELVECHEAITRHILRYLDIPHAENMPVAMPQMQRQADALSEDWVDRYYACKKAREED